MSGLTSLKQKGKEFRKCQKERKNKRQSNNLLTAAKTAHKESWSKNYATKPLLSRLPTPKASRESKCRLLPTEHQGWIFLTKTGKLHTVCPLLPAHQSSDQEPYYVSTLHRTIWLWPRHLNRSMLSFRREKCLCLQLLLKKIAFAR